MSEIKSGKIKRVTAGDGGEALLILGSEKTAIFDCGMAYCGGEMTENTERELSGRPLDYVILTHTHYDHVGGLPYLRKRWPDLISLGAAYGKKVLEKSTARCTIKELSEIAHRKYRDDLQPDILMEGLAIDKVLRDGDIVNLGEESLHVLETPGHTLCSLSFLLEPDSIIFPSETIGVLTGANTIISPVLKSYKLTMGSIEKCRRTGAKHIISPHYGWVEEEKAAGYWDLAVKSAGDNIKFVLSLHRLGLSDGEMLKAYTERFWVGTAANQQPIEAFLINAKQIISVIKKEFV